MQIVSFVFLCAQFYAFQIQIAPVTITLHLGVWSKVLVNNLLQSLSLHIFHRLHSGKQRHPVLCFGYSHYNLGFICTTASLTVVRWPADIAIIQLHDAGK